MLKIYKRSGKLVDFDEIKIVVAIEKAMKETKNGIDKNISTSIAKKIKEELLKEKEIKNVEDIQDMVEVELMRVRPDVAKKYILYREKRNSIRQSGWEMTDLQRDIFKNKYEFENEGFFNFINRVSNGNDYIAKLITHKKFIPAGRILANRGLQKTGKKVTYSNCFIAGTKVITKRGLINIEDVKIGDYVLTSDDTWQVVNYVMDREYSEDLYKIEFEYGLEPVICTANHEFLTDNGWIRADRLVGYKMDKKYYSNAHFIKLPKPSFEIPEFKIKLSNYITLKENQKIEKTDDGYVKLVTLSNGGNNAKNIPHYSNKIKDEIAINKDVRYLLGRWIGDGSTTRRKGQKNHSIFQIVFNSQKEQDALLRCVKIIKDNFGVEPSVRINEKQHTAILRIENPLLAEFVAKYIGFNSQTKRIPKDLIGDMDVIIGIIDSDGTLTKMGNISLVFNNKELLEDIRLSLTLNGIYTKEPQRIKQSMSNTYRTYSAYKILIPTPFVKHYLIDKINKKYEDNRVEHIKNEILKRGTFYKFIDDNIYTIVKDITIIKNNGKTNVYNLSVENNHTYTANGVVVHNCYVIPAPEDNLESIFDTAKRLARTYSYGGGCGIDISKLRPKNAKVNNAAKESTGAVSFMELFSTTTGLISQRGRRGALMISIDCHHPDIIDFINIKNDLTKVTKANISIRATDDFMKAIENDEDFELYFEIPETGEKISKKIKAKDLLYEIAKSNWNMGEPGFLYWDRIKKWNLLYGNKEFKFGGVNPCAEEPLPDFGSCNLGSMNLSEYVINPFTENAYFDFDSFAKDVKEAIIYLNEILDEGMELHPLKEQQESVRDWRQTGLGIMGLADMFIKLGMCYGSPESLKIADKIGYVMINSAMQQSALLAKEYGTYPKYDKEATLSSPFFQYNADEVTKALVEKYGLRNSQLLTIAPTGSISTMLGVSGGIEPIFEISYIRKTESLNDEENYYKVYTPIVAEYMKVYNLKNEEELPEFFVTAMTLPYESRILMQSVWQKHIDASISSTVNLPENATIEDIMNIYLMAWKEGLKGITIFRNNCFRSGILLTEKPKEKEETKEIIPEEDKCPVCGGKLKHLNGCNECADCGWSACSV